MKAIRVHPDDLSKLSAKVIEDPTSAGLRQIVDSPFLSEPIVIAGTDDKELVNGQILARLPDAFQLQCAPQSDG